MAQHLEVPCAISHGVPEEALSLEVVVMWDVMVSLCQIVAWPTKLLEHLQSTRASVLRRLRFL
jgi:hypothetical protein